MPPQASTGVATAVIASPITKLRTMVHSCVKMCRSMNMRTAAGKPKRCCALVLLALAVACEERARRGCADDEVTVDPSLPGLTAGDQEPYEKALARKGSGYHPRSEH